MFQLSHSFPSKCQHVSIDTPTPLKSVSSVSILAQTPHPPSKRADVILECSLRPDNIPRQRLFSSLCQNTNNHTKIHQLTNKSGTKITKMYPP